jgi:hypothetical protein
VAEGEMQMTSFWPEVRVFELDEPGLRVFGDPGFYFRNVNTRADLEDATRATEAASQAGRPGQLNGR